MQLAQFGTHVGNKSQHAHNYTVLPRASSTVPSIPWYYNMPHLAEAYSIPPFPKPKALSSKIRTRSTRFRLSTRSTAELAAQKTQLARHPRFVKIRIIQTAPECCARAPLDVASKPGACPHRPAATSTPNCPRPTTRCCTSSTTGGSSAIFATSRTVFSRL